MFLNTSTIIKHEDVGNLLDFKRFKQLIWVPNGTQTAKHRARKSSPKPAAQQLEKSITSTSSLIRWWWFLNDNRCTNQCEWKLFAWNLFNIISESWCFLWISGKTNHPRSQFLIKQVPPPRWNFICMNLQNSCQHLPGTDPCSVEILQIWQGSRPLSMYGLLLEIVKAGTSELEGNPMFESPWQTSFTVDVSSSASMPLKAHTNNIKPQIKSMLSFAWPPNKDSSRSCKLELRTGGLELQESLWGSRHPRCAQLPSNSPTEHSLEWKRETFQETPQSGFDLNSKHWSNEPPTNQPSSYHAILPRCKVKAMEGTATRDAKAAETVNWAA